MKLIFSGKLQLADMKKVSWMYLIKCFSVTRPGHLKFFKRPIMINCIYFVSFAVRKIKKNENSAEGGVAPAGAKVTGATIRTWLVSKFISFLAMLSWKSDKN